MKKLKPLWKKCKLKLFIFLTLHMVRPLIRLCLKTCRVQALGVDTFQQTAREGKCIIMLWHNRIVPVLDFFEQYAPRELTYGTIISNSRDGELMSRIVTSYPQGKAIRVHHQAKHKGLSKMIEHLNKGCVIIITPDGPQGPPYMVKKGIIHASYETSAKILPLTWTASSYWELNTWDKMRIPKPFSKIQFKIGPPIQILQEEHENLPLAAEKLQKTLLNLDN